MSEITHKERLWQIDLNLMAINQEIRDGHWQDDCLQEAVYCQVEINRMVWELNQLRDRAVKDEMEKLARPKGKWIEDAETFYKAVNEYGGGVDENTPYFTDDIACSKCLAKFSVIDNETERFDFCPNCGADMRGENND